MRRSATIVLIAASIALAFAAPSLAEEPKKFEATIAAPGAEAGPELFAGACPAGGDFNGVTYAFFELEGDFTNFKSQGPAHLFNEPNPVGVHDINDYDIDMYAFDAKCKEITPSGANGPAGLERFVTKRPARFVVVAYWSGVHPDLPVTLEVANSKIK